MGQLDDGQLHRQSDLPHCHLAISHLAERETMKVIQFDTYKVSIALGEDPSNVGWSAVFLGSANLVERVTDILESSTKRHHSLFLMSSGLPANNKTCLTFHQCLFLVKSCGLPPAGSSLECIVNGSVAGHIWIDKSISVIK